jgi:hypothetical protein
VPGLTLTQDPIHLSDGLLIAADLTRLAVFNHLPVEPDSGGVIAARMLSDSLFYESLPFVLQFGLDPAGHGRNCKAERKGVSTNLSLDLLLALLLRSPFPRGCQLSWPKGSEVKRDVSLDDRRGLSVIAEREDKQRSGRRE